MDDLKLLVSNELERYCPDSLYKKATLKLNNIKIIGFSQSDLYNKAKEDQLLKWAVANTVWFYSKKLNNYYNDLIIDINNIKSLDKFDSEFKHLSLNKKLKSIEKLMDEDYISINLNKDIPEKYKPAHGEHHLEHPLVMLIALAEKYMKLES